MSELDDELDELLDDSINVDPEVWDWYVFEMRPQWNHFVRRRIPRDFSSERPGCQTEVVRLGYGYLRKPVTDEANVLRRLRKEEVAS